MKLKDKRKSKFFHILVMSRANDNNLETFIRISTTISKIFEMINLIFRLSHVFLKRFGSFSLHQHLLKVHNVESIKRGDTHSINY